MRFPLAQTMTVAKHISREKKKKTPHFPLVLMLEPLHRCNLTCEGCGRIREYKDVMHQMLGLNDCLKAIDDCNAPVVSICGGEPLIYPQIKELVEETVKRKKVTYLCTNGTLLDKKLDLFKPSKYFNINIHIDGMEDTHDMIVEKKGTFKKIIENIKLAKKAGFTVCTNTTVYKETKVSEIEELFKLLTSLKVDGFLISPGFDYKEVEDQSVFLTKEEIRNKFNEVLKFSKKFRLWSTPLFLEFCAGIREYNCTPWGNVTYNVKGWKAPCYLITDKHFKDYGSFISQVDWDFFASGKDKRCKNCMCHCGFEASAALKVSSSLKDTLRMTKWTLS
jgi:hopanoid biosynthesis associated radical SAM protein HpnH